MESGADMTEEYRKDIDQARAKRPEIRQFLKRLNQKKPRGLDAAATDLHEEVFEEVDCLQCANCCKTTSPVFTDNDIDRIAKHLRMKPSAFVDAYLHLDEDEDYVLNQSPCEFLLGDNTCLIYEVRPRACREYPHTNRKRFHQIWRLTAKNTEICPAAARVVAGLMEHPNL